MESEWQWQELLWAGVMRYYCHRTFGIVCRPGGPYHLLRWRLTSGNQSLMTADQFYANVVGFLNTYYRKHTESETTLPSKTAHVSGGALNSTPTMFQPTMLGRSLGKETIIMLRYDTIQDAILTCARKPTWVGLIYRTKTTTKNCKTEKLKSKRDILEVTVKVLGNHVVSSWEEKESLQWEGFGEKGFKLRLMQSLLPLWISIMLLPPPIRIIKSHSQNTVPIIVGHFAVYCYWFRWATCVVAR